MRVALVSPYSYTYPGGVGRHVEALAQELTELGHEVRLLAPYDPDDRIARVTHRGARPQRRPLPDHVVPLGRTLGLPMNGAVSNLATFPKSVGLLGRELRHGGYDVVHVHEPNAPYLSAGTRPRRAQVPVVATFHTYSTSRPRRTASPPTSSARGGSTPSCSARIAVSEAAQWTAQRYYGGRYRIVPNGVDLSAARPDARARTSELRIVFVGRAEERKGLPVLLRAFEALRGVGVPARLTVAGATAEEVEPLLLDPEGIEIAGQVDDDDQVEAARRGRPAVRAVARRRELRHGAHRGVRLRHARSWRRTSPATATWCATASDGVLVPVGDAVALGEALLELALGPGAARRRWPRPRSRARERFAWPHVAARGGVGATRTRSRVPEPDGRAARVAQRLGAVPAEPGPRVRPAAAAVARAEAAAPAAAAGSRAPARRVLMVGGAVAGVGPRRAGAPADRNRVDRPRRRGRHAGLGARGASR